jgi:hypothetical protein
VRSGDFVHVRGSEDTAYLLVAFDPDGVTAYIGPTGLRNYERFDPIEEVEEPLLQFKDVRDIPIARIELYVALDRAA